MIQICGMESESGIDGAKYNNNNKNGETEALLISPESSLNEIENPNQIEMYLSHSPD